MNLQRVSSSLLSFLLVIGLAGGTFQSQAFPPATFFDPTVTVALLAPRWTDVDGDKDLSPTNASSTDPSSSGSSPSQGTPTEGGDDSESVRVHHQPYTSVGQSYQLKADESVGEVVVVFGDADIQGTVDGDVVVIGGQLKVNGKVSGDCVNVGRGVQLERSAHVQGDIVGVGGGIIRAPGARVDGKISPFHLFDLPSELPDWVDRTLDQCVYRLRPLSLSVALVRNTYLAMLLLYVVLGLLLPATVDKTGRQIRERGISSLFIGILGICCVAFLLMVMVLLIVPIPFIPLIVAPLLFGAMLGKAGLLRQMGHGLVRPLGVNAPLPLGILVGGFLLGIIFLIPVIGLFAWALTWTWSFGAIVQSIFRGNQPGERPSPGANVSPATFGRVSPGDLPPIPPVPGRPAPVSPPATQPPEPSPSTIPPSTLLAVSAGVAPIDLPVSEPPGTSPESNAAPPSAEPPAVSGAVGETTSAVALTATTPEPPFVVGPSIPETDKAYIPPGDAGISNPPPAEAPKPSTSTGAPPPAGSMAGATAGTPQFPPATPTLPPPPSSPARELSPEELLKLPRVGLSERLLPLILDWCILSFIVRGPVLNLAEYDKVCKLLELAYFAGFYLWRGATPMGLIFGLRVVRLDGRPLDIPCVLVRGVAAFFGAIAAGIGYFWCSWDPAKQTWHDKLAGTVVVKTKEAKSLV